MGEGDRVGVGAGAGIGVEEGCERGRGASRGWVVGIGDATELAFEPLDAGGVDRAEGLDRDVLAAGAGRLVDHAHAAVTEQMFEAVAREPGRRCGDAEETVADAGERGLAGEVAALVRAQAL